MKTIKNQNKKVFKEKKMKINKMRKPSEIKIFSNEKYKEDNGRHPFINGKIRIFYYLITLLLISNIFKSFCHKRGKLMILKNQL